MNDAPTADDRERRLIDALVSLAKSFREERDRLSQRLARLEHEIDALSIRLDAHQRAFDEIVVPAAPPRDPSRTPL
jgi:chromosome segregation ATPase